MQKTNFFGQHTLKPHITLSESALFVLQDFDVDELDLILLCGGYPVPDLKNFSMSVSSISSNTIEVNVLTDQYVVSRRIDFLEQTIYNSLMIIHRKNAGIGTNLLINQLLAAKERNFQFLQLVAAGPETDNDCDGYVFWGKLGFLMDDINDREDFLEWQRKFGTTGLSLGEFLLRPDGERLWRMGGFEWTGEFLVEDNSASWTQLINYLETKDLTWMLDQA